MKIDEPNAIFDKTVNHEDTGSKTCFRLKNEKKLEKREKSVQCLGGRSFEFHNVNVKNFEK